MKKLVTALIIVLPLVFVVALFAVTNVVSLSTAVKPTGIEIYNKGDDQNGTFYFDITKYDETNRLYEKDLEITVLPERISSIQSVICLPIVDAETGEETNIVSIEEDENGRYFELRGIGVAKVTYASELDNDLQASIQIVVTASDVTSAEPRLKSETGETLSLSKGENGKYVANVKTGKYKLSTVNSPDVTPSSVQYSSSDGKRLFVGELDGSIDARFSGKTEVTIKVGSAPDIVVEFNVTMAGDELTVDGRDYADIGEGHGLQAPKGSKTFSLYIETKADVDKDDINLTDPDGDNIEKISIEEIGGNAFVINVTLKQASQVTSPVYTLTIKNAPYPLQMTFAEYEFAVSTAAKTHRDAEAKAEDLGDPDLANLLGKNDILMRVGDVSNFEMTVSPRNENITYEWTIESASPSDCLRITKKDNAKCTISARAEGTATLKVNWTDSTDETQHGSIEYKLIATQPYSSLSFGENTKTYIRDGKFAIASDTLENWQYDPTSNNIENADLSAWWYETELSAMLPAEDGGKPAKATNISGLEITLSNNAAEYKTEGGKLLLHAKSTGSLSVTVGWKYGALFGVGSTTFGLQTVKGVKVGGKVQNNALQWEDMPKDQARDTLMKAMQLGLPVVLMQDVFLGEELFYYSHDDTNDIMVRGDRKYNVSEMRNRNLKWVKKINTTWDWTYYKNSGQKQPTINYALEITADIYGNGKQINGEYVTNTTDKTGKPQFGTDAVSSATAFNGPLDFVNALDMASVKGQDNIVFLVRNKDVKIDNVTLAGCLDDSLRDGESYELSLLNYMGTTLEVMNDMTITNSVVKNGRTVMRVYGKDGVDQSADVNASAERINVTIDKCTLQNAREFILKIGTNRWKLGTGENPEPSLFDGSGNEYTGYNTSACDARVTPGDPAYDPYFVDNFVLTDVELKDSTLSTSGLFSIGMESHFAGTALAGSGDSIIKNWYDLAATSYPAVLHLVGKVVLDDWKDLQNVDSSTLIENLITEGQTVSSKLASILKLDIKTMLKYLGQFDPTGKYQHLIVHDEQENKDYVHGGIALYGGGKNYHGVDMSQFTFEEFTMPLVNISILTNADDVDIQTQGMLLPQAAGTQDFRFFMYDDSSQFSYKS